MSSADIPHPMPLTRRSFLTLAAASPAAHASPCDVRAFGATGAGDSFDTGAIQKAIDACAARGGGTVYFGAGRFLTGPLVLRSGVHLHLDAGAVLLGSPRLEDYPERPPSFPSRTAADYNRRALIFADQAEDVGIFGRGTIDGQGYSESFTREKLKEKYRPLLLLFSASKRVRVSGVTLRRSAMWMQNYLGCEDVVVDGISVYNRPQGNRNYDGIDLDDTWRARVSNCYFESSDDSICLKSTVARGCRDIVIMNCVISSRCNAIKMGTDSTGGFRNISIANCAIFETRRAGLALECVDGGALENVVAANITMEGVGAPLFLRLGARGRGQEKPVPGTLRNITIANVTATKTNNIGSSITGQPGCPVENVTLDNIRIVSPGGGTAAHARRDVPEYPDRYPEHDMFAPPEVAFPDRIRLGQLPAHGIYVRHARNVTMSNLSLGCEAADHRPALAFDDAANVRIVNLDARSTASAPAVIQLKDAEGVLVSGSRFTGNPAPVLRVEGRSRGIVLDGNDLEGVARPVRTETGVLPDAVRVRER